MTEELNMLVDKQFKKFLVQKIRRYCDPTSEKFDNNFFMEIAEIVRENCPFEGDCWDQMCIDYEPPQNEGYY